MRIPLLVLPYKVCPTGYAAKAGWKGWRLRVWGVQLLEPCDCYRLDHLGLDCECVDRGRHRHSRVGFLLDAALGRGMR